MRVKCVYKSLDELPAELTSGVAQADRIRAMGHGKPWITPGKEYVVYAVDSDLGNIWYYILNDDDLPYPTFELAVFFELVDPHVSKYWVFSLDKGGAFRMWPSSWFQEYYHQLLVEGDQGVVADFVRLRGAIDAEDRESRAV